MDNIKQDITETEGSKPKRAKLEHFEDKRPLKCPYLDTVTRQNLDFDMDKVCSVSLTNLNVYCCLVCGCFLQGRGPQTPCYSHSVHAGHFVFIHLRTAKTYCLPDNYEIVDQSLNDVKKCLQPTFTIQEIANLDKDNKTLSRDIHGVPYLPGFIGLNNVMQTDYINVVLHALSHIQPLRDFFLRPEGYSSTNKTLLLKVGELLRKMWSPWNFKSVLSPQELVNDISIFSKKKLSLGHTTPCIDVWNWLINELHAGLLECSSGPAGTSKTTDSAPAASDSSIISDCFAGIVEVVERRIVDGIEASTTVVTRQVPFKHLSLTIPPPPLFRDADHGMIIPQIPIFDLLRKFNGTSFTEEVSGGTIIRRCYHIRKMPKYLVFNLDRKGKGRDGLASDKNRTIVTFPARNLEMRELYTPLHTEDAEPSSGTKYDLIANICHQGIDAANEKLITIGTQSGPGGSSAKAQKKAAAASEQDGVYMVHVHNKATDQWYAVQDLAVTEILPHQIALSESHMLVYELKN